MTTGRARWSGLGPGWVLITALFAAQAAILVLSPILPQMADEFGVSTSAVAQLRSVSAVTAGVVALVLADGHDPPGLIPASAAEMVTVSELIEESPDLDGSEVVVEGELVGDYGFRDDVSMWTQLNGDVYVDEPTREGGPPAGGNVGVGVTMAAELADGLDHPGGYHHRDPIVRLRGTWRHHDPQRQGETYLDVASLEVIEPGRDLDEGNEGVVWWTVIVGSGLLAAAGALWVLRPRGDES